MAAHKRAVVLHEQTAELQQRLGHKEEAKAALQRAAHAQELYDLALAELAEWGLPAAYSAGRLAEVDEDATVVGAGDVVDGQADDAGGWLGEQQHQTGGHAGAQGLVVVGEELAEQFQAAVLVIGAARLMASRGSLSRGRWPVAIAQRRNTPQGSPLVVVVGGVSGVQVGLGGLARVWPRWASQPRNAVAWVNWSLAYGSAPSSTSRYGA